MSSERILAVYGAVAAVIVAAAVGIALQAVPIGVALGIAALLGLGFLGFSHLQGLRGKIAELEGGRVDERLGLAKAYVDQRDARDDVIQAIEDGQRNVTLVGISHRTFLNDDGFLGALDRFLRQRNVALNVYILRPGSEALRERAQEEGDSAESFEADVRGGVARLTTWAKAHGCRDAINFFYYDEYPLWRIQLVDDRVLFVSSYPPGKLGQVAQVLRLEPSDTDGSLFSAFSVLLQRLRNSAEPSQSTPQAQPSP